ncbi:LysR substrate-binding domain-containing protein [Pseudomonas sp. NPDC007930]|uniref:LysR family transcriptional regulator n=1 Tax=Pseudomonas sp. NPDC007930 TaxID=3364417 RepID=UPI0036E58DC3
MELRHFRYFVAVAEALHFGRAAQQLGISQPPLSQQIQALEAQLGVRLFNRTNRRVELSEAGRLFLDEARQVLAQVDKAADVARRAQAGELGELKVGFTSSAPFSSTIPQAIHQFRRAFPAVQLTLLEMSSHEVVAQTAAGHVDVGLTRPVPLPDNVEMRELFREPLVAVLPAGHPLAEISSAGIPLAALADEPFVFFPRNYGSSVYAQLLQLSRNAGFSPRFAQEASEAMTIIGLVSAGLGVSVLPASFHWMRIGGVVYRRLLDEGAQTAIWLVQRKGVNAEMVSAFGRLLTLSELT